MCCGYNKIKAARCVENIRSVEARLQGCMLCHVPCRFVIYLFCMNLQRVLRPGVSRTARGAVVVWAAIAASSTCASGCVWPKGDYIMAVLLPCP